MYMVFDKRAILIYSGAYKECLWVVCIACHSC